MSTPNTLHAQDNRPSIQPVNTLAVRIKNEIYSISTERDRSGRANLSKDALESYINNLINSDSELKNKFSSAGINVSIMDFSGAGQKDLSAAILIMAQHENEQQKLAQKEFDRIYMNNTGSTFDSTPAEIKSQIEQAQSSGEGTYYFDGRGFQIQHSGSRFTTFIQKKNGGLKPISGNSVGDILQKITSENEKKEEKNKPDTQTIQMNVEMKADLDPSQIFLALDFVDKNKRKNKGFYSFENKLFGISYAGGTYKVEIQNADGTISVKDCPDSASALNEIRTGSKKVKEKTETSLTVDMGKDFDENKLTELCDTIKKSGKTVGYYTIGGKKYKISLLPADSTASPPTGEGYKAEFPGRLDKEEHTEVSSAVLKDNAQNLAHHIAEEIHIHDHTEGHHDVSFKDLKDFIKTKVDDHSEDHPKEYTVGGKKVKIWRQKGFSMKANSKIPLPSLALYKMRYYAEVPGILKPLSDTTPEGLAKQIIKKAGIEHAEHKKEHKEKTDEKGHEKKGDHKNEHGHEKHEHHEEGGTKYDTVVNSIFGNGIIGKSFKGVRNMVPKGIRGLSGAAFDGALAGGVVGGLTYGTSIAFGSLALSTFVVPAMTTAFVGYGAYSAIKRFNKWRASKGGGDSHGGGHGGH